MAVEPEDAFQKELIELFVQEAHEWLQQIHVALDELQQGPPSDRHLKLALTIKAGITNLGGSAATIGLADVERASFSALPFVEAVHNPALKISANDFIVLCKQLGHIHTALTRATGITFDADSAVDVTESIPVTIPCVQALEMLRGLQERQLESGSSNRNLIQIVIAHIEGMMGNGITQCDVTSMRAFLDRLGEAELAFQAAVLRELPQVTDGLGELTPREKQVPSPERQQLLLDQVSQLWTAAQQVNASQAMTFFMGLHSFLNIVMQQRVAVAAKKFDAVESRLREMAALIQNWIDLGQAERVAIGRLLHDQM